MPQAEAGHAASPLLLEARHISKRFGGVLALDDVSFTVAAGEILCLAGENGCGKSTLIKLISGVHTPEPGATLTFDGTPMQGIGPLGARNLGIQVIWQDLALFPEMSVAENIAFEANLGAKPRLVNYAAMRRTARAILDRLGVALPLGAPLRTLPIAQRQIVAIARALIRKARLVFMDEPTASLSHAETNALLAIVRRLSAEGIAVVFVSHRLAEVLAICSRVTVLRDGRLVGHFPTEGMTQSRLTELMTGNVLGDAIHAVERTAAPVVLDVRQLSRAGEFADITLSIRKGEILGLTGRLGAGRTELALSLFGMTQPSSGTIALDGAPRQLRDNRNAIRAGIAYVSEDRLSLGLIQPQSIAANATITVLDRLLNSARLIDTRHTRAHVADWVKRLGVKIGQQTDAISTLSGGNQQKIVLAKWLATAPKLLILDSPTVGVDVGARAGIFVIVRQLASSGMAILLISDEIQEVYFNADRILHMRDGRIVDAWNPRDITIEAIEAAVHA